MRQSAFVIVVLLGTLELVVASVLWLLTFLSIFGIYDIPSFPLMTPYFVLNSINGVLMITGPVFSRMHGYKRGLTLPTSCFLRLGQIFFAIIGLAHTKLQIINFRDIDSFLDTVWGSFLLAAIMYYIVAIGIAITFNRACAPEISPYAMPISPTAKFSIDKCPNCASHVPYPARSTKCPYCEKDLREYLVE